MIAALCLVAALAPQQTTPPQAPPAFHVSVDAVEVDVSVMRGSTVVAGLTAENFALTDNGVPQQVTSVTLDRVPLSVLLLLDTSGSVAGDTLEGLVNAIRRLTASLRLDDRAALMTFSHDVHLRVPFTGNKTLIDSALTSMSGRGATALYDAVQLALELRPIDRTRTVLLLFTDGVDTASWLKDEDVLDAAKRTGTVIHAIELHQKTVDVRFTDPNGVAHVVIGKAMDSLFLGHLVEAAGGRVWSAASARELETLFTKALDEMRARYLLTFTPSGVKPDGWHNLKVTLKNARSDVTARPAYFVAPAVK